VPEQVDDPVDGSGSERARTRPPADHTRLPQIGDEVLDVRGLDVGKSPIAKPLDERLDRPVVVLREGQPLRDDVSFL
jgi:hypothetical protein